MHALMLDRTTSIAEGVHSTSGTGTLASDCNAPPPTVKEERGVHRSRAKRRQGQRDRAGPTMRTAHARVPEGSLT